MSVLVVGSVAYDSVQAAGGTRKEALGGSAIYFAIAASFFTDVSVIAVVGDDFQRSHVALLESRRVDTSGLEQRPGKTFRWAGVYDPGNPNARRTLDTQLNVFADFSPRLGPEHRRRPYVFLANIDPALQLDVLNQMDVRPRLVSLDTMNLWIEGKRETLERAVKACDILLIDETEARQFARRPNTVKAASAILEMGPHTVVVKRGEHGAVMFNRRSAFAAPAFPLEEVTDPTGAGDSFAGGFMGYLAATGDLGPENLRKAVVVGSVMGSFAVESFSVDRLSGLTPGGIEARYRAFADLVHFAPLAAGESLPSRGAT